MGQITLFPANTGGTPGGTDTQIQFNDAGAFGGSQGLTFDKTTRRFTLRSAVGDLPVPMFVDVNGILNFELPDGAGGLMTLLMGFNDFNIQSSAPIDLTWFFQNNSVVDGASVGWFMTAGANFCELFITNAANTSPPFAGTPAGAFMRFGTNGANPFYLYSNSIPALTLFGGSHAVFQSATAPAVATNGTIATAQLGTSRIAPAGAVTGIILEAGTIPGQKICVINQSAAANTITMAAAGTSHVAEGVTCVIAGLKAKTFVWNSATSLWYAES